MMGGDGSAEGGVSTPGLSLSLSLPLSLSLSSALSSLNWFLYTYSLILSTTLRQSFQQGDKEQVGTDWHRHAHTPSAVCCAP